MTYQVIARKWRPQNFDELIGQFHISNTLKNAIMNDRVGHAFLFTGVRGVGKTTTARILAKRLNCENPKDGNPCNECSSCLDVQKGKHIDIIEIDGASNTGVDDVKVLREAAKYLPSRGKYKIYIIDEVHMLSEKAFNALLKTLEEPPPHVKFIFATTDPHKIPITIKSRCQIYDFRSISLDEIFNQLKLILDSDNIKYEESALYLISKKAEGSMRDAQSLLEQVIAFASNNITKLDVLNILGVTDSDALFEMTEAILNNSIENIILLIDKLIKTGINLVHYYKELIEHFHNILVAKKVKDPYKILKMPKFEIERYIAQSKKTDESFIKLYQLLIEGFDTLKASQFQQITFEMNMIKLAEFKPITPLSDILKFVNKLSKSFNEQPDAKKIEIDLFGMIRGDKNIKTVESKPETQIIQKEEPTKKEHRRDKAMPYPETINNPEVMPSETQIVQKEEPIKKEHRRDKVMPYPETTNNPEVMPYPEEIPEIIDFNLYQKLVKPFFEQEEDTLHYFYQNVKIPIIYKNNILTLEYSNDSETMFKFHPDFKEKYENWLKKRISKELSLEIKMTTISKEDSFDGILQKYKKEADKRELKSIRSLEGVRKVEEVFNLKVKKIIRSDENGKSKD